MTLDKAQEILREQHNLELVDIYSEADLERPAYWIAASERGGIVAVTGEAPI